MEIMVTNQIAETISFLATFIGKQVSVYVSTGTRHSFDCQISVNGKLEKHSVKDNYRVYINDGAYSYFSASDVSEIGTYGEQKNFKDGSEAVIKLHINNK